MVLWIHPLMTGFGGVYVFISLEMKGYEEFWVGPQRFRTFFEKITVGFNTRGLDDSLVNWCKSFKGEKV